MKLTLLFTLSILFFNCGSTDAESPQTDAAVATHDEPAASQPTPPSIIMAEILPPAEAKSIIGCQGDPMVKQDDRDYSTAVTYTCTDPFSILSASLVWRKDGAKQDVRDRDDNPALEKVSVPGADAAHLMPAQGRLMVAKGKYLLTVQLPGAEPAILSTLAGDILERL